MKKYIYPCNAKEQGLFVTPHTFLGAWDFVSPGLANRCVFKRLFSGGLVLLCLKLYHNQLFLASVFC